MDWHTPANFSMSIDIGKERVDLLPFDEFELDNDMTRMWPTAEYPVNQVITTKIDRVSIFD